MFACLCVRRVEKNSLVSSLPPWLSAKGGYWLLRVQFRFWDCSQRTSIPVCSFARQLHGKTLSLPSQRKVPEISPCPFASSVRKL